MDGNFYGLLSFRCIRTARQIG